MSAWAVGRGLAILGREGMGAEATEADFDAWVAYVCERIDQRTGLNVDVDARETRDVQSDAFEGPHRGSIKYAVQELWTAFCAERFPRPVTP